MFSKPKTRPRHPRMAVFLNHLVCFEFLWPLQRKMRRNSSTRQFKGALILFAVAEEKHKLEERPEKNLCLCTFVRQNYTADQRVARFITLCWRERLLEWTYFAAA